ncbi:MAG: NAD(P)/FAD-dependent oxidoreductase [Deltaproteobacteria bacterium]|nr:NAD(P)/FAD-dependent oxidoreductase [Deltaproteobacteria bacterium]
MAQYKGYDVIFAGAGHNALTCAAMLAKTGVKVILFERNAWIGGGVVTREMTAPGFKSDTHSWGHIFLHSNPIFKIVREELEAKWGLKYILSEDGMIGGAFEDGTGLVIYKSIDKTCEGIARLSQKDAGRYREIYDYWKEIRDGFIRQWWNPPQQESLLMAALEQTPEGKMMLRNQMLSCKDFLEENFESEYVKAFLLFAAMAPNIKPDQENMANLYFLMVPHMHDYGEGIPQGGSGELSNSLGRMVEGYGGCIVRSAPVKKFIVKDSAAVGVLLEDGTEVYANKAVVTAIDPKHTYLEMFDPDLLPADVVTKAERFKPGKIPASNSFWALHEHPILKAGREVTETGYWRCIGTVEDIVDHSAEVERGILPTNPGLNLSCPTIKDPTRAPAGKHVLVIYTAASYKLRGQDWDEVEQEWGDRLLNTFRKYTTNMGDENIIARYIQTPKRMVKDNPCMLDGAIMGGEMAKFQAGTFRPFPGYSNYRGPFKNFYHVGPWNHPGGGVTGMGGITAIEMMKDFKILKKSAWAEWEED